MTFAPASSESTPSERQRTGPVGHQAPEPLTVRRLGRMAYSTAHSAMKSFAENRAADQVDEVWLVEHPPVYTLGVAGRLEHLLRPNGIEVVRTERGGQVTYHGPGQVVAYTMVDLARRNFKVRTFVAALEQSVMDTLATYNVIGERIAGAPGVYVASPTRPSLAKIAALGIKVRHGATFHGLALNVAMDLAPFHDINPCGYEGLETVDLRSLGVETAWDEAAFRLVDALALQLGAAVHWTQTGLP